MDDRAPLPSPNPPAPGLLWDVFCRVIDNHGDLGVLWRLSRQLARRGHRVRLWVDDASALQWMAPEGEPGVQVLPWALSESRHALQDPSAWPRADVWVEGFGCEISPEFIAAHAFNESARGQKSLKNPVWLNLEYLTAEAYAERCHRLPSPVMSGPARGWTKHFFYPGFSTGTGGLLREPDLAQRQQRFDRAAWLSAHGVAAAGQTLVSLFCYEPHGLPRLLQHLAHGPQAHTLLVAHGRPRAAVLAAWSVLGLESPAGDAHHPPPPLQHGRLRVQFLPPLRQDDYDHLLWACDWNFVRGEDSLVRALWAGKPFVWHIYPQDDGAHHAKLAAFLDRLDAPAAARAWHLWWNAPSTGDSPPPALDARTLDQAWAQHAREGLCQHADLVSQLLAWTAPHAPATS
jgi:uncharacterized repeat protein (TIGR03837 family)